MDIKVLYKLPQRSPNSALVLSLADGQSKPIEPLPSATQKAVNRVVKRGDLPDAANSHLVLHDLPDLGISRAILLRMGKLNKQKPAVFVTQRAQAIAAAAGAIACDELIVTLNDNHCPEGLSVADCAQIISQTLTANQYTFSLHDSQKESKVSPLKTLSFLIDKTQSKSVKHQAEIGIAIAKGMGLCKDLGNLAPNICTPEYLAAQAKQLGKGDALMKVSVLDETKMEKLGMGAFLSVSQGSRVPARLIAMDYQGGKKSQKPIVLVGKGVTFDTGGISIKPSAAMDEMKFDMCGAATVFGVMHACQALGLKLNIVGVVAAAENMPDGDASRPGDVVTTLSGKSVEILNTDAEGRLVLCDTLTWIEQYKPKAVVDIATLTGACIVALGDVCSAVLGNDEALVDELYSAGQDSADPTWPLPLWDEYQSQLDSNFADIANLGGKGAGTITAACFLSRFTENYPWAHLDIAGIAWKGGADKGATGRPVPLLMHWILNQTP